MTTNIMVRDGCTVVIGGLMREELAKTTTQVPAARQPAAGGRRLSADQGDDRAARDPRADHAAHRLRAGHLPGRRRRRPASSTAARPSTPTR